MVKNPPANTGDPSSISESGSSPGEGFGNPLQYSWLENSMGRGAWRFTVHGDAKVSDTTEVTKQQGIPSYIPPGHSGTGTWPEFGQQGPLVGDTELSQQESIILVSPSHVQLSIWFSLCNSNVTKDKVYMSKTIVNKDSETYSREGDRLCSRDSIWILIKLCLKSGFFPVFSVAWVRFIFILIWFGL